MLSAADIRAIAAALDLRPTKQRGQNFLVDPNTVRRLVRLAGIGPDDVVLEVGPGIGSLTLGLLGAARRVLAVEVDPALAAALPATAAARLDPATAGRLTVLTKDALRLVPADLPDEPHLHDGAASSAGPGGPARPAEPVSPASAPGVAGPAGQADAGSPAGSAGAPTVLAANLPYNIAVPLLLGLLERFPSLERGLVMVQAEVADRLTSPPGGRVYGVPSVKLAWYAESRSAGAVPRSVFWPVPNVDSGLVAFTRRPAPAPAELRPDVFAAIDAAFAQRRKTLRTALAGWAGSPAAVDRLTRAAGVDPGARGETLDVAAYCRLAAARAEAAATPTTP
ncbi:16S rRNA (adenine(1518)-N(6)/adenine(1519)-N(6))-dimethyltransferase RsmA [Frankia sp. AgB1.9]|nr:16S rRNA (adenine(1518)-N(6)/adenine(1519)-N(6))-dimethyltransferase RsmA [Frankia sp. AgW1.1]MBL7547140.1 16S rRNA (adenine(1518)-N(6)/adenine(1519)-N(6))-dimethyltransferase RsmA [Frankia sp. AgB1.9]MBL7620078.1 16S rRNA (adenine(1518)-N(6)/adenine(1519)-N(6))-dimethyltransferase RsmA [Frankia sp. AgB1.8]